MQIIYCDQCGIRIPEKDLEEGRAVQEAEKSFCVKCKAPQPHSRETRSSKSKIPAAARPSSVSLKPEPRTAPPRAPTHSPAPPVKPGVAASAAVAAALLFGIALFAFSRGSSTGPAREEKPSAPAPPPAPQSKVPALPADARPAQPAAPAVVEDPAPREDFEALARAISAGADPVDRARKCEAFLEKHGDSAFAAQARRILEEARLAAQPDPAPQPATQAPPETSTPTPPVAVADPAVPAPPAPLPLGQPFPVPPESVAAAQREERRRKNLAALNEIEMEARGFRWKEALEKIQAFEKTPPGGEPEAEISERLAATTARVRESYRDSLLTASTTLLYGRSRRLPGGRIELAYDFLDPRQRLDFGNEAGGLMSAAKNEALIGRALVRHLLPWTGDLRVSYEVMVPSNNAKQVHLNFYDYAGDFGARTNDCTGFWPADESDAHMLAQCPQKINPDQWYKVEIHWEEKAKRARLVLDGKELLTFTDPKGSGAGFVCLGSYCQGHYRNLVISGMPALEGLELLRRKRKFAADLTETLRSGKFISIFTKEDQDLWDLKRGDWKWTGEGMQGKGSVGIPGLLAVNFEAQLEVSLFSGKEISLRLREGYPHLYRVSIQEKKIYSQLWDFTSANVKKDFQSLAANTSAYHKFTILSRGPNLRVTMDETEILFDLNNVPPETLGFFIGTWQGIGAFRNAKVRLLP